MFVAYISFNKHFSKKYYNRHHIGVRLMIRRYRVSIPRGRHSQGSPFPGLGLGLGLWLGFLELGYVEP